MIIYYLDLHSSDIDIFFATHSSVMQIERMLHSIDSELLDLFSPESRKIQRRAREELRRILDEQERLNSELEEKKRKLDFWSRDLNKREVLTEQERQKLEEEKKKVNYIAVFV